MEHPRSRRPMRRSVLALLVAAPVLLGCAGTCSGPFGLQAQGASASSSMMCSPPPPRIVLDRTSLDVGPPYQPVTVSALVTDPDGGSRSGDRVTWSWLGPAGVVVLAPLTDTSVRLTPLAPGSGRLMAATGGATAEIDVTIR